MARRRVWRYGLLGVGSVIVLAIIAGVVVVSRFNPNDLKPKIIAAVQQATGRQLALNGPVGLKLSLWPTVELRNVTLANPPGFSRPDTATLDRLDLQLAILPLLHHQLVIDRLVLVDPTITLETNRQGATNWQFTPPPSQPAAPPQAAPHSKSSGGGMTIGVRDVQVKDATVTWHNDRTNQTLTLAVTSLSAKAASPDAPMKLAVTAAYNGTPFTLDGDLGPLNRLQQPQNRTPWPVKLTLATLGATVGVHGSLTQPLQGRGYKLTFDGTIPDLTRFAPLLPGTRLPPLHDVQFATQIADSGHPVPTVDSATLQLGPADLGSYVSGLKITAVDISAPPNDQPVHLSVQASRDTVPLSLTATVGAGATTLQGQSAPVPVDMIVHAGNASLTVKGTIAHPETLSGANLTLAAVVPDLGALAAVARHPLPAVKDIALQTRLTDGPGGFQHGAALQDLSLTTSDGDVSGDLSVAAGPPQTLDGTLHAKRIDADALLAALGKPVAPPPPAGTPPTSPAQGTAAQGTASGAASRPAPPAHGAPAPRPAASGGLFSDTPLPFAALRQANANLAVTVDDLRSGGLDYRGITIHLVLQNGKLQVAPFDATLPEGKLVGRLSVDANPPVPPVALTLHAPGLAVAPLLAAAGVPGYASGNLEVYADLHGAGASPHAIVAGLDGSLGLAMQGGTIDTRLLNSLLGPVLERANLLQLLGGGGTSALRCFALRADLHHGVADLRTLLLNSALLTMDGTGSANLASETLDLRLRPQGRIAGTTLVVPLDVSGPIRAPAVKVNAIGAAKADVGSVAGAVAGAATPLGLIGGLLGGGRLLNTASADTCPGPLALARGETPPAAAAAPAARSEKTDSPVSVLKNLFR